jgi:hypothetical protein
MFRRKWIGWSVVVAALLLALLVLTDYGVYWSHRSAILGELQAMPAEERHPPLAVSAMVERYYRFERLDSTLARRFQFEFHDSAGRRPAPTVSREIREILLTQALRLHLSREERLALFCHRMQFDGGAGLSNGAMRYYSKRPADLNDLEIAGLIASDWRGKYASPFLHPDHFESARQQIVASAHQQ